MARSLRRRARLGTNSQLASSVLTQRVSFTAVIGLSVLLTGCVEPGSDAVVLTADLPLHLEDHLDAATIDGSEIPTDVPEAVEWRFDEPQPDWKPVVPLDPTTKPVQATRTEDALRLVLSEANSSVFPWGRFLYGAISVDLPDWKREEWAHVLVRARTSSVDSVVIGVEFNLREEPGSELDEPFDFHGEYVDVINDGSEQSYLMRADWSYAAWKGPWRQLGVEVAAEEPADIDILSITLIPKVANYADAGTAARTEIRNRIYRQALYTHTPGRVEYRVKIPEAGRLDFAMGVLREDVPVTFRVTAIPDGAGGGEPTALFEEHYAGKEAWGQRSVDLTDFAGQTVTLGLETDSEDGGRVALWGAPTITGGGQSPLPNVVFYVFDGGAADYMSVYGYNRRTTPTLERLASEGVVFERAYSNSSFTKPSTASFMTSLQNSVMGGLVNQTYTPVPEQAVTMAERMHRAGYQTAVFTGNPNAGTLSNLQRGVDLFREDWEDFSYTPQGNHKESSKYLNEGFWNWREDYRSQPFWVHFQTTDMHGDFPAPPPFGGLFVTADEWESFSESFERLGEFGGTGPYSPAWDSTGISRTAWYSSAKGLYDEAMAHNDYRLGQLIDRLKARGEWENTLLIIGGDHSIRAAFGGADVGLGLNDSLPPRWSNPILRPTVSRVPLIFVWPGHIEGGQRIAHPVSMIDVLPTLLDLLGLPPAEIAQGQSLAPLLLGTDGWAVRPVILDEFSVAQATGKLSGVIEVVDGQWGASLEINPDPDTPEARRRPSPLLLYDLWNDPMALWSLHEERPDLVEHYTAFLEARWEAHQALAQQFTPGEESPLTPEQLRTLRSLGYIR